jgi:hypothetical protein
LTRGEIEGSWRVEVVARYLWTIERLALAPGDVLIYAAMATDNHAADGQHGQVGRSAPMRIKIISETELEMRLREDLSQIEGRLRQAAVEQAELRDRTSVLVRREGEPTPLTDVERDTVAMLSAGEARLARQLRELAGRLDELRLRMERNHAGDDEVRAHVAALGDGLRRTANGPVTSATGALSRVRERSQVDAQQQGLSETLHAEDLALEQLHGMIRTLSQWGTFQGLVTRTRDLLERQNQLNQQTADLGKTTLGKPIESLSTNEAAALKRAERQQGQLAGDVDQHLARLDQMLEQAREKDRTGAEAIENAVRTARAGNLTDHLRTAADALQANRTAAASMEQRAASQALRKMLAALRERENRELAELRKRLDRAEEQVAWLLEQQTQLRSATHETAVIGGSEAVYPPLAQEQRTLERNTKLLADELVDLERAAAAARMLRQSAIPMGRAEAELEGMNADAALPAQDEALRLLSAVLADLEAVARAGAEDELRRSLAHVHDTLEATLAAQLSVNAGIAKLRTAVLELGRLGRTEARDASKLAREQGEVGEMIAGLLPELQAVVVYEWALRRVGGWMEESRVRLDARTIDEELSRTTDRVIRELEKLIGAIVETQNLPMSTEFIEADADGGGSSGEAVSTRPIPTVAELLVLRAMQTDINQRTRAFNTASPAAGGSVPEDATEATLRELAVIGDDQAEVRRLTEMVTSRAQGP